MPVRIEYHKGDKLGPYHIEFVEEVEPHICRPSGRKIRKGKFICPKCGAVFETIIFRIKSGKTRSCGCIQKKINIENGKKNGKKNSKNLIGKQFGKLIVLEKTQKRDSNRHVIWKCKCDCGNIVDVSSKYLITGATRSCGCNTESRGEEKIRVFLQSLNINFETQKTFKDCINLKTKRVLRFDFYLPNYNCCIEYDGEQHFKSINFFGGEEKFKCTQLLDSIKNEYCKNNNIKLIRISYMEFDNIEEILTKELNL